MLILIGLTVFAGILGGLGNWFISASPTVQETPASAEPIAPLWWKLLSCITLGVIAAALIPLFLSMAKSDLVPSASGAGKDTATVNIDRFIYFGFCLVAAVTSRNFIDTVASRALRLASENEQRVTQVKREVNEISAGQEEPEPTARAMTMRGLEAPIDSRTKVLRALVAHLRFTRRNAAGISQETGVPLEEVNALLLQLSSEGLVDRINSTDGRILWTATKQGRATLN